MSSNASQWMDKLFMQGIISCGALKKDKMEELYTETSTACNAPTGSSLLQYLERLNRKLQGLGMKVGVARMEDSLESWYGLVNLTPDAAAKEGSKYSAQQLEFFNKIVKYLIQEEGVVSSTQLLNVTTEMERKINKDDAQKFLRQLTKQHWLKEEAGKLTAGPRFILELRPFLAEIYGEQVSHCRICKDPVIRGQSCDYCDVKMHLVCVAILAGGRSEFNCPGCRQPWEHSIPNIDLPQSSHRIGRGPEERDLPSTSRSHKHKKPRKHK